MRCDANHPEDERQEIFLHTHEVASLLIARNGRLSFLDLQAEGCKQMRTADAGRFAVAHGRDCCGGPKAHRTAN